MQIYALDKKSIKQSLANAKSFLKDKNIKLPPGIVEELVAKTLFQKTWNDALSQCESASKKNLNQSTVYLQTKETVSSLQLKSVLDNCCKKANFDISAIKQVVEKSSDSFYIVIDQKQGIKNELTFLFYLWQNSLVKGLQRERVQVEVENLSMGEKPTSAYSQKHELEVSQFLADLNVAQHKSVTALVSACWSLEDIPYNKKADWFYSKLSNLNTFYNELLQSKHTSASKVLTLLSVVVPPGHGTPDTKLFNAEYNGLMEKLKMFSKKVKFLKYSHPAVSDYLILEASSGSDAIALSTFLGDTPTDQDASLMLKEEVLMSLFEYNNMPEFQG